MTKHERFWVFLALSCALLGPSARPWAHLIEWLLSFGFFIAAGVELFKDLPLRKRPQQEGDK